MGDGALPPMRQYWFYLEPNHLHRFLPFLQQRSEVWFTTSHHVGHGNGRTATTATTCTNQDSAEDSNVSTNRKRLSKRSPA